MDILEISRRWRRRLLEIHTSLLCRNRKCLLFIIIVFPVIYYIWSRLLMPWKPTREGQPSAYMLDYSLENKLMLFHKSVEVDDLSAVIQYEPVTQQENSYLSFVGNGLFGVIIMQQSPIYLQNDRVLTLPLQYYPIVSVEFELMSKSAKILDYMNGIMYTVSCYMNDICITTQYYAHRTIPHVFVQDIEVVNPASHIAKFYLSRKGYDDTLWLHATVGSLRVTKSEMGLRNSSEEYETVVGPISSSDNEEFYVSIIAMKLPTNIYVAPRSKYFVQVLTSVCESERNVLSRKKQSQLKSDLQEFCFKQLKTALKKTWNQLRDEHTTGWQQLWSTGISISTSKAKDSLNGDKINATMYYVLSNVRSPTQEEPARTQSYVAHGCYGNIHHTFQATNLWSDLSTLYNVQKSASYWLLTLQKQGCDHLVATGALGVMQAMVLSFGSFRFTNQHLEFNMHPKFLHRDYTFRRLQYGNMSQVNVTVMLQEDNKAILLVSLEKSDRPYYACDGGCLDEPVQLSSEKMQFPVKLTEPVTAILYISPDSKHLHDLRHAIHVHEVGDAPAHEHSVIALHKHGHTLGGLPTFFWVCVGVLIVVFHLFLFKLIYNEYCGGYQESKSFHDKHKVRYSRL